MKHLLPKEAWALIQQQPDALFVDVRMEIESQYVGRPPGVINIPWYEYPEMKPDPKAFVLAVEKLAKSKDQPVVLLCRSGLRTVDAGIALEKAGFTNVVNVLDGFEGELDDNDQRGREGGWRFEGLPWTQT
ncbi:rhodanese-like domain-containing protein [Rhodoferax sp.]|uniref:rhodanese-like domain-containing protein n=1 Tax=Rhodoferax sp. TaxID=50421 RepID=UPI00272680E8|nr:rhodanese-like domain-containing protein [Rhodoferax sp.]MDO9195631.1 rhodanese-like domain-containing protein [Rhodoferax sp.]